jgi:hypothetical protein
MGLFYTTLTLYRPLRSEIFTALRRLRRVGFVSPTVGGYTVLYDRSLDTQDESAIDRLGCALSGTFSCAALAAALHDDDVLFLWLFQRGRLCDRYDSLPGYFDPEAEPGPPSGGNGGTICKAFRRPEQHDRVTAILRANLLEGEMPELTRELERHQALIEALGMPPFAAGLGYEAIAAQHIPEAFGEIEFVPVGQG